MKITDVSISPFTLKMESIANNTESSKEYTKHMDGYLMELFTDFLQAQDLISKSVLNKTLGIWVDSVTYDEFSNLFDSFWRQMIDEIPRGKLVETIMGIAIQIVSIFQRMKPPERSFLREVAKTRVALKLLDTIAQN
jgi:hypothetical protein